MTDLPDSGPFTHLLIGAWWPAAPGQPTAAVTHWSEKSATKQHEAQELDNLITLVGDRNAGRTADDMLARLRLGKERLLDVAHQCRAKSEANAGVASAVNHLRERLTAIADDGNRKIDEILKRHGPVEAKLPDVNAVIIQANSDAAGEGATALNAITDATQRMFDHAGSGDKAREWLTGNGANFDAPPAQRLRTAHEVTRVCSNPALTSAGGGLPGGEALGGFGGLSPLPGLDSSAVSQAFPSGIPEGVPDADDPAPSWEQGVTDSPGPGPSAAPRVPPSPASTPMAGGLPGNLSRPAGSSPGAAPSSAASGPLPGYGADLRPAGITAPAAPAALPGSAATATPPSPTATATAAPVASAGDRSAPGKATAGTATTAKRDRLRRTVDAVARQSPGLAWAAGLRDDEATIMLVTDLAAGWIPPGIKLPRGVGLLAPAQRRRNLSVVELLGPVIAVATHRPNGPVADAGPGDPIPGAGEHARHGRHIDELRPTLFGAVGAATRLPRIAQTVARAVARRSGVADNEIELFRTAVCATENKVLSAYPRHAPVDVADWMLLAAIDALIDGSDDLARYHLAWHRAVSR